MIVYLGSIIEYSACRSFSDDLLERESLVLRTWDELIQIVYVGLVMLAIVVLERLLGDMWSECIEGVWERWECESHRI
jgi:hypothetical protein